MELSALSQQWCQFIERQGEWKHRAPLDHSHYGLEQLSNYMRQKQLFLPNYRTVGSRGTKYSALIITHRKTNSW